MAVESVASGGAAAGRSSRVRLRRLAPVTLLALPLAALYRAPAQWLWSAWTTDPYYTHGALVAALAVGLGAWRLRAEPPANARPHPALALAVPAALALYGWGFLRHSAYAMAWSGLALVAAAALATGGTRRLRGVAAPLLLAALAFPTPWTLDVGLALQGMATSGSALLLAGVGVPLVVDIYTFHVRDLAFEVTPACSGMQGAVSLLAVAAVIAAAFPLSPFRRRLVLAAAVPLALALNVARILAVVGIALRWGPAAAEGFFHGASGAILFVIETLVLLGVGGLLTRSRGVALDG